MLKWIQNRFALTAEGSRNLVVVAFLSWIKFILVCAPPTLAMILIRNYLKGDQVFLFPYVLAMTGIGLVLFLLLSLEYRKLYDATYQESAQIRMSLTEQLKRLPLSFFAKHHLSDISQTVMMDVSNIEILISHALPQLLGFLLFLSMLSIGLICGNPILGISGLIPVVLGLLGILTSRRLQRAGVKRFYHRLLLHSQTFQEAFETHREIKSYGLIDSIRERVEKGLEESEWIRLKGEFTVGGLSSVLTILPALSPFVLAIVGLMGIQNGTVSIFYFLCYLIAFSTLSAQFAMIAEFYAVVFFFEDSIKRIRAMKNYPLQEGQPVELEHFNVSLRDVHFSYGDTEVIQGVTFEAQQGQVTALVGPSGSGKTTLLRLISRLYDADSGTIQIGGHEVKEIATESLYQKISIVFQEVELFHGSILENIRLGRSDASDEEVMEAARLARVEDFVLKLPEGYQTLIGENGARLSGGERQRLSIARAILKDAPLIILDEISSALDIENEMLIQKALSRLIRNKTVIVISHRLASVERADHIVLLDQGKVVQTGTHEELLAHAPLYRLLVERSKLAEHYQY